ncbi:MAG: hypothetical protein EHM23_36520, partial [Acidobacteria bacterium]
MRVIHIFGKQPAFVKGFNGFSVIGRRNDALLPEFPRLQQGGRQAEFRTREGGDLFETLHRLDRAGCARFVVTDVSADGMLRGPNFALLHRVCEETGRPVIASGGISTIEDILAL